MELRARSIGRIWLLWIRVRAFDWSDPDPDPLGHDLVNSATETVHVHIMPSSRVAASQRFDARRSPAEFTLDPDRIRTVRLVGSVSRSTRTRSGESRSKS